MSFPSSLGNVSWINSIARTATFGATLLSNWRTNGDCSLGTLSHRPLPHYLTEDHGWQHDGWQRDARATPPWGSRTVFDDPDDVPTTNVTRYYDLTVARCELAPDGFKKNMICINGQFPGPTLSANWGDNFEITVHNELSDPEDGTAVHWHG